MRLLIWLAGLANGFVLVVSGSYFVFWLCVTVFRLTGQLSDGPMFHDLVMPSWPGLMLTLTLSGAVFGVCIHLRRKLQRTAAAARAATE
jgi:hypothetical protein